eukprot:scaffold13843_cov124-Isochrysis_galbana.AAC.2
MALGGEASTSESPPSSLRDLSRRELQTLAISHGVRANMKSDAIIVAIEALWTGSRRRIEMVEENVGQQPLVFRHSPTDATPGKSGEPMLHAPDSASSAFFSAMHDRIAQIMATSPAMKHSEIRRSFHGLSAKFKQASQKLTTPNSGRREAVLRL